MNPKQKIAFFGSDEIALPSLEALADSSNNWEICGVLTQPDRRSGRGRILQPNAIKRWAMDSHIPVMNPEKPGKVEAEWIKDLGVDLVLVMAYGHILKEDLLTVTPFGCFNLHASLLPKYRGASPIESAMAMGEMKTGVTLMQVIPEMDAGPIIDAETVIIDQGDTGPLLRAKIAKACVPLIKRNMGALLSDSFVPIDQNEKEATYCRKLSKIDGRLNFELSAKQLVSRNLAFSGWPGSYFLHFDQVLKVGKISEIDGYDHLQPGQRGWEDEHSLIIGTRKGAIAVEEIQKPGGKMLPISDFVRGYSIPKEIRFSSPEDQTELIRC